MVVTCDYCGEEFEVVEIRRREEYIERNSIAVTYFVCPHCNKEYIASVTDSKILKMREDLERARETFSKCDLFKESQRKRKAWKEMEHYKRKIINYQDKLKKRYMKEMRRRGY